MSAQDQLHRYLFENAAVRGELVNVSDTWRETVKNHDYPAPVKTLLGEMLVATSLLTATLKFDGEITVQLQGDGPLSLAVINGNNNQELRGVARIKGDIPDDSTLKSMVGNGYLVITISLKRANVIREWWDWKVKLWRSAWKITSCAQSSCQRGCLSAPATKAPRVFCCR